MNNFVTRKIVLLALTSLAFGVIFAGCHPNNSPVINNLVSQESWIDTLARCQIQCLASDVDNDALSYTWSAAAGTLSGGGPVITWTAPGKAGIYNITVDVFDEHGCKTTSQLDIEVKANHDPVIQTILANPRELRAGDESVITCIASDPDGDKLKYSWSVDEGKLSGRGAFLTWTAPGNPGKYKFKLDVTDDRGGIATAEMEVEVKDNQPPIILNLNARTLETNPGTPVKIECIASDPEKDSLSYAWTTSGGSIIGEGSTINWRAPEEYGTYKVGVTVSDDKGSQTSEEVSIEVKKCG